MPKFVIVPKVDHLYMNVPEGVTQQLLQGGEFDTLEQAQAVATAALGQMPTQTRVIAEVKMRLSGAVQVAVEVEGKTAK